MRFTLLTTIAALGALACGGGKQADQTQTAAGQSSAAPAPTGPVVEVKMTGNGSTVAAFEPKTLTIAPGTTVRFINVSGGPHNIAFWGDSIPAGAAVDCPAAVWVWSACFPPPQARAPSAAMVVSRVKRIADVLRKRWAGGLVNVFTI